MARKISEQSPFRLYLGKFGVYFARFDDTVNGREVKELNSDEILQLLARGHEDAKHCRNHQDINEKLRGEITHLERKLEEANKRPKDQS